MIMIVQDEKGTSYWGGFEVKSTIMGSLCFNAFAIADYFVTGVANDFLAGAFFLGMLLLLASSVPLGSYNPMAREHAQRVKKLPFESRPPFNSDPKFKGR
jgi:hypothetical protein